MQDRIEYFVQPYSFGMTSGPVIRVKAATPRHAVGSILKEQLTDCGKLGQLRAYVSYFGEDDRHHRVRYYAAIPQGWTKVDERKPIGPRVVRA